MVMSFAMSCGNPLCFIVFRILWCVGDLGGGYDARGIPPYASHMQSLNKSPPDPLSMLSLRQCSLEKLIDNPGLFLSSIALQVLDAQSSHDLDNLLLTQPHLRELLYCAPVQTESRSTRTHARLLLPQTKPPSTTNNTSP
ncbi:hypothetical protein SAICODRAFT_147814 [Saitoella complicata NRRL Y-17804]|uniref:uncharacterized protein n=1 Tax=Saitoella complicata (strain BCRC 22490 / CBS 7301 / JCM 7358 / NBRC 10748 / NRRL Y-17804) TaxID=698492 RepID=UPI000866FC1C|nr:uncharacterized protein SAICODRAFT_147814 [Saitoella complicata NRRL Y-17804]ODQ51640.1 hypothetical protein SAICODRAFT_147814 [Saitoella complicata NRRL Y-17804]